MLHLTMGSLLVCGAAAFPFLLASRFYWRRSLGMTQLGRIMASANGVLMVVSIFVAALGSQWSPAENPTASGIIIDVLFFCWIGALISALAAFRIPKVSAFEHIMIQIPSAWFAVTIALFSLVVVSGK